jgi:hypothetical protein
MRLPNAHVGERAPRCRMRTHGRVVEAAECGPRRRATRHRMAARITSTYRSDQQALALSARQRGNVAEREVDPSALERRKMSRSSSWNAAIRTRGASVASMRSSGGRKMVSPMSVMCKLNVRSDSRGLVGLRLTQGDVEEGQCLLDGLGQALRPGSRRHAALRAHEERIAVNAAQSLQRMADRRLRYPEPLRARTHVARDVHRVEGLKEVEVDRARMHESNNTSKAYALDK